MKILVINSGSSSIKFALYLMPTRDLLASGLVERIGENEGALHFKYDDNKIDIIRRVLNHKDGLEAISEFLLNDQYGIVASEEEIQAVGHRVVHGGEKFHDTVVVDDAVKDTVRELSNLAPLHNPPNLLGIEESEKVFKHAIQVAVFDTAFHQTLPMNAYREPLPPEFYERYGIRKYGFHGTSHSYVAKRAADYLNKDLSECNFITLHLGNGCSATAIKNGRSVDTSLGMTTIGGLMMGTRIGDIDPGVVLHLVEDIGMGTSEVKKLLGKNSGLKGVAGDNDMRELSIRYEQGDESARLAIELYTYRIKKFIGAYMAVVGSPLDAVIFTAGVGENSPLIRRMVCSNLEPLGIQFNYEANESLRSSQEVNELSTTDSLVKVLTVPTNEELEIANESFRMLQHQEAL
jgi:acetate kinase